MGMHGSGVLSIPHTEPILDVSCVQAFCAAYLQVHADHAHLQHKQTNRKSITGYTVFLALCAHGWCTIPRSGKLAHSKWFVWNAKLIMEIYKMCKASYIHS